MDLVGEFENENAFDGFSYPKQRSHSLIRGDTYERIPSCRPSLHTVG